jgi:acetyl-CoA acetyltransferase
MTAINWGWGIEATANRLMELSDKTEENGDEYAVRTARNAAQAVERNRLRLA